MLFKSMRRVCFMGVSMCWVLYIDGWYGYVLTFACVFIYYELAAILSYHDSRSM
jgi:hypothetical protein